MDAKARCSPDGKRLSEFRGRRKDILIAGSFDAAANFRWPAAARLVLETVSTVAFIAVSPLPYGVL